MKGGGTDTVYGWRLALYKLSKASFKDWEVTSTSKLADRVLNYCIQ